MKKYKIQYDKRKQTKLIAEIKAPSEREACEVFCLRNKDVENVSAALLLSAKVYWLNELNYKFLEIEIIDYDILLNKEKR